MLLQDYKALGGGRPPDAERVADKVEKPEKG